MKVKSNALIHNGLAIAQGLIQDGKVQAAVDVIEFLAKVTGQYDRVDHAALQEKAVAQIVKDMREKGMRVLNADSFEITDVLEQALKTVENTPNTVNGSVGSTTPAP